jgi:hypothetical protein
VATLVATYPLSNTTAGTTALPTPSFTPAAGELIVAKVSLGSGTPTVTGGGLTWSLKVSASAALKAPVFIYTAVVGASPAAMTVSMTPSTSTIRGMTVKRYTSATVAASPAVSAPVVGSATAPSATLTTTAANSIIEWLCTDWNESAVTANTYRSSATQDLAYKGTGSHSAWHASQTAATAGAQTIGMTAPTGQDWQMVGIEILDASSVSKTGSDSGTGSESGSVSATVSGSDSGTGSETGFAALRQSGGDAATGSEAGYISIPQAGSDSGAGSESGTLGATIPGGDSGTGSSSGTLTATAVGTDSATGSETGFIKLSGTDVGSGSEALKSLRATIPGGDTGVGSDGGYVEVLYGDLVISLWGIDPATGASVALPDFTKLTLAPQRNSAGSITVEYPTNGLNFNFLRSVVTSDRDLEVEIWTLGSPTGALRGYLQQATGDDVKEDANWTFAGGFLELRMAEALVFPQPIITTTTTVTTVKNSDTSYTITTKVTVSSSAGGTPVTTTTTTTATSGSEGVQTSTSATKGEIQFNAATPGAIMGLLFTQAQGRGALTDIALGFTTTADSNGVTWPNVLSAKFSPNSSYDQILNKLVDLGLAEWAIVWTGTQKKLQLWIPQGRGTDRTVGNRPVVVRRGRNLLEAPRKWSVSDSGTAVLAAGSEGVYQSASDASALARRGRRIEVSASSNSLSDPSAVTAFAQAELATITPGALEVTHGIGFLPGEPRPVVAYDVGDWVYSQTGTTLDRLRVVRWSLTVDAGQNPAGTVTLNDIVRDALTRQQAKLKALTSGETVVGTSTATPADDTMPPAAPTGLVVGSNIAYQVPEHTQTLAELIIGWGEVTTNADGTPAVDVDSYRVQYTYLGAAQVGTILDPGPGYDPGPLHWIEPSGSPTRGLVLRFGEVEAGVAVAVRVAAIDRSGNQSAWSSSLEITTASDDTPAPVPAAPTLSVWFRTIDITSDGLGSVGEVMPSDWDHNEVWLSQAASPTLPATASEPVAFNPATTGAQHVANLYGAGTWNQPDIPIGVGWYAVLRSVDRTGNVSAPSAVAGPVTAEQLVQIDIGPGAIGRLQVIDGEIVRAKIGDAAINSAKVEELQAGLITTGTMTATVTNSGIIQTASTGSRLRFDSSGLQLYNAANTMVGQWKTSDASMLMTGTFRTALSGERLELLPDGTFRLYPAAGTNFNAIYNEGGGGLIFRSGFDGANRAGFLYLRSNSAQISYGTPGTLIASSRLQCSIDASELWGGQIVYRADRNFGTTHRHTFTQFSGNADIFNTVLYLQDTGGTGQFPWFHSIGGNSGFIFGPNYMATANSAANLIELRASNVASPSSRRLKQREKAIGWARPGRAEPVTALDVIRGAKAKEWEYIHEAKGTRPPRPGKNQQRILDEQGRPLRDADGREMFEEVDVDWSWEEQPAPKHYGPMAEDLEAIAPDLVRRDPEDPGMIYTDVRDLLGVLWKAVDELADQLDTRTGPRTIRP